MVTGSKVFRYLRIVHSIPTVQDGEYVVFDSTIQKLKVIVAGDWYVLTEIYTP